ncbi:MULTISPECIES: hypothetical protein [Clostridium]|uniref:hypothetical protein n=1 Tax=Clostridium TaxID=1485 RepID=UPI001330C1E0|nr:hypothetical protein [Clostridium neonatale]MBS4782074.1 hypothetical protein [Clostridium sp.]CAI3561458.1 hypothetical protein CNEO3_240047 [Clostridium neonatale]CAI3655648.1 hypothetical protein CNEO4_650024 [Clostridium neonatale]CAI3679033.1 hypothetical protein CNEO4_660086 [Clostridium neonatale]CAI3690170.1 hypothetical protein CNEO4_640087 [Clostridium neonatale]
MLIGIIIKLSILLQAYTRKAFFILVLIIQIGIKHDDMVRTDKVLIGNKEVA